MSDCHNAIAYEQSLNNSRLISYCLMYRCLQGGDFYTLPEGGGQKIDPSKTPVFATFKQRQQQKTKRINYYNYWIAQASK